MDIRPCLECDGQIRHYVFAGKALYSFCKKEVTKSDREKAAYTYYAGGCICCEAGEYDESIRNYSSAIEMVPEFENAYSSRGFAYSQKKEYDRAMEDYTMAIELDPAFSPAFYNRGISYKKKGEYLKATADFEKFQQLEELKNDE